MTVVCRWLQPFKKLPTVFDFDAARATLEIEQEGLAFG